MLKGRHPRAPQVRAVRVKGLSHWPRVVSAAAAGHRSRVVRGGRPASSVPAPGGLPLEAVFDQAAIGIALVSAEGRTLRVNRRLVEMLGYAEHELLDGKIMDLTHPDDLPQSMEERSRLLGGDGSSTRLEKRYLHKDGRPVWASVNITVVRAAPGAPHLFVLVIDDIQARKAVEAELARHRAHLEELVSQRTEALDAAMRSLAERQALFRTVTDAMPGAVYYWDAELRCRLAHGAHLKNRGFRADEIVGRRLHEVLPPAQAEAYEPLLRAALAGAVQVHSVAKPDGTHTMATMVPDLQAGVGVGVTVVVGDVTALKRAELQMHQLNEELAVRATQAEAATRSKSAFLANMSHEIRTPMNAIIGLTHLMTRETRDALQRERLGHVDTAARHLLQIINDILDLSKIEAGKMTLALAEFPLDPMLSGCLDMVGEQARAKGLALTLETDRLPAHVPARLVGDATRLRQALVNLLANAVKFTERGSVWLRVDLACEEPTRLQLRFEVQDTGEGIAPAAQANLFSAFEQADSSITRRHGGTGLGLALTRHLVHLMGGEIGVRSAPGTGSTFSFTAWLGRVPPSEAGARLVEAVEPGVAESALRRHHAGRRVLLAEDNPVNQHVAVALLHLAGLVVDVADDGQRAVELACGRPYDVVLMDMQMPSLDGLAATRLIRERVGARLPVIAMTANAFGEDRVECLAAGMNDHVAKPVDPEVLYAMLLRWLPSRRAS